MGGLFLLAAACAGCNLASLPYFLMLGSEPTVKAQCKLASDDKDKEVKVVILTSCGLDAQPEFLRVDHELSLKLYRQLQEGFKQNKEKVTLVPVSHVEKYKDEHNNWRSPAEVGKYFEADYVINLTIGSISLYEQGSSRMLYRGHAEIHIDVLDVSKASEGPIYEEEYSVDYPRRGPIPAGVGAGEGNPAQFRLQFLNLVAKQLSWRFTAHLQDEDNKLE
jgi:hypothetical protein